MKRPWLLLALAVMSSATAHAAGPDLGFTVPKGFRASLVADESLANDIYAMTLDSKGRIVVTGQGYIKTLHDDNGNGKADRASFFAETRTGGMGLCSDGNDLLFCGDGWLSRYRDANGDGKADGPPEHIMPLPFAEHGGHAMRKGPDGYWYVIAGNEAKTGEGITLAENSMVHHPEAGRIFRLSPDLKNPTVIAHGFRNPYDFDFNEQGDLFTYDSDCERDYFLPWYTPTRVYHVALGMHHGWRLTGSSRSWARPGYFADSVDVLQPVGRGSPTGVACYRHRQFPEHYRGGLFILDWTFGIVYFLPLTPEGASYKTTLEKFIVPTGTSGFAPSDVEVAPDGSLLVCIGGRRTRGAIFRIEAVDAKETKPVTSVSGIDEVLRVPQPLSAWSRTLWEPEAKRLGIDAIRKVIVDEKRSDVERIRAIEVFVELHGPLDVETAKSALKATAPSVRARAVWALARSQEKEVRQLVHVPAQQDPDARVRLIALEVFNDRETLPSSLRQLSILSVGQSSPTTNLLHPDKRVRQATARLIALRFEEIGLLEAGPTELLGIVWNSQDRPIPEAPPLRFLPVAVELLDAGSPRQSNLDAIRLIELVLGDLKLDHPSVEVYSGYSVNRPVPESLRNTITSKLIPLLDGDEQLADEAARLLAIIEANDPSLPAKFASFWTSTSPPTRDFHFLVVFSRLKGSTTGLTAKVADTILGLDRKLQGQQLRTKQVWSERLVEVVRELVAHDPSLGEVLLVHPAFVAPAQLPLASEAIPEALRPRAARKFLDAIRKGGEDSWEWSGDLLALLSLLPPAEVRPLFRDRWEQLTLRDAIVRTLAVEPEEVDRSKFLAGLESSDAEVVKASIKAITSLPRDSSPEHLAPILRALRSHSLDPKKSDLPGRLVALLERQSGMTFQLDLAKTDATTTRKVLEPVFAWFERTYPSLAQQLNGASDVDLGSLRRRIADVDWSKGDPGRGAKLFETRGCRTCHTGVRALGPDLGGVTQRLSRSDLFTAIAAPSLEVAPPYRTTIVETKDGRIFTGMIAFESADGVIVQTDTVTTVRIADPDIASRRVGDASLMPTGLLKDLTDRDIADLDRYLQSLTSPIARTSP